MLLTRLLNACHRYPGFVYEHARLCERSKLIEIDVRPRRGCKPMCSGCYRPGRSYDRLSVRRFEFIPVWGFAVMLLYCMRRVECRDCGVKVEALPWAMGKHTLTRAYMLFLAHWARRLSWRETARAFRTSWEKVYQSVEYVVRWGLENRQLAPIRAIGVDEIQVGRGHQYLTLVYQIESTCTRLLWVGKERTTESFREFFTVIGTQLASKIEFVCSDMWPPYLQLIKQHCTNALNILDRFHIVAKMNKALDEVRAAEARQLVRDGYEPVLKKSRWCLLKRSQNLTDLQRIRLRDLLRYNLKSVRAYLLKEDFQQFWNYESATWAGKFLDQWCTQTLRSRIAPVSGTSNRLSSISGALTRSYAYSASGSVTSDGAATFTYDDAGRLVSATKAGVTTTYALNALGQRVRKTSAGVSTYFVYDEAGHLLGEYDNAGGLIQETAWLGDISVATIRPNGASVALFYVHSDHLNTPRRISRPSDNVIVWRWGSDAFGTSAANQDPDGDTQAFVYGLRFPGQYLDAETGLHYNYYRDYDPSAGRYVQSDPIGLIDGAGTYTYTRNRPVQAWDALGLMSDEGCCSRSIALSQNGPASGWIICCEGRKVACALPQVSSTTSQGIKRKCTLEHEREHWDEVACSNCTSEPFRPNRNEGIDDRASECWAHWTSINCLKRSIGDCGNDSKCRDEVKEAIQAHRNVRRNRYDCYR